jgi:peptidoglycan hydrolase-like protein with peptidoglycan-binding domain/uncharacterized protein YecT (DUF1311 family)
MMKIIIACIATFLLADTSVCYSQVDIHGQPSIDCTKVHNTVAVILCRVPEAAQADWELNSAWWARYFTLNDTQRRMLAQDQQAWRQSLDQVCALPRYQTPEDQAGQAMAEAFGRMMLGPGIRIPGPQPITQAHVNCVLNAYHARAAMLRSKLTGDALAESHLSPEQHAELQQALAEKGFLRPDQIGSGTHDGEFGPITRNAIKQFQQSLGASASGFLSDEQRSALAATAGAPRSMTPDTPSSPEWFSPLPSMGAQNTPGATAQAPATTAGQANRAIKEAVEAMGHDNGRALYLLLPLARQNNPKAEVILDTIFRFGNKGRQAPGVGPTGYEDVPRDDATAAILFRRAADQGDFDGESNLALMYKEGAGGLPKDYTQAAAWYLEAAHQNDPYVGTALAGAPHVCQQVRKSNHALAVARTCRGA